MRFTVTLLLFITIICPSALQAQNTFVPLADEEYHLTDRLETIEGLLSNDIFLATRPVSRAALVNFFSEEKSHAYEGYFTNIDNYNLNRALSISGEWNGINSDGAIDSRRSAGPFYRKQPDLLNVNKRNFFLAVNPILSVQATYEKDNARSVLWNSTQGAEARARIGNIVGAYVQVTNNYEEPVIYFRDKIESRGALPNAGPYRRSGNGYQYLMVRGYADVALIKNYVNLTVGYDKHFIGDGIRSLFLSDYSAPVPFVRINTKIWKLNYQNLFMAVEPQSPSDPALREGSYKYISAHHLSANITPWLNVGVFESVTFARDGRFEFGYMNPVIFYRAVERGLGSPDKVALGINAKALPVPGVQLYGQFLLNEFTAKEFFGNRGYMHNKWGAQAGLKYFNAFTISNLDLQAEVNMVRPYTYQHYSEANYTNYNQPLAHPLGAGFREALVQIHYQPLARLAIDARFMYYQQGVDSGTSNVGSDIFKSYRENATAYGVKMINGIQVDCYSVNLNVAYELRPRLYAEIGGTHRSYTYKDDFLPAQLSTYFYGGLRLNISRRDYNQF